MTAPIPIRLPCPSCGELHVDAGKFATKPHHTHACQSCGMVWRPALIATVGVRFLPGFKDEPFAWLKTKHMTGMEKVWAQAKALQVSDRRLPDGGPSGPLRLSPEVLRAALTEIEGRQTWRLTPIDWVDQQMKAAAEGRLTLVGLLVEVIP